MAGPAYQNDGSGVYNYNPQPMPGSSVYNSYQMGAPGLQLPGGMLPNILMSMLLGQNMAGRPNDNESLMQAAIQRRRSMDYMMMMSSNLQQNAITNSITGGVGLTGGLMFGSSMINMMTGGVENGLISRLLNPVLGGNPILAQQKLYAGLQGLAMNSAFGMRGESSFAQTNNMMRSIGQFFYNHDDNDPNRYRGINYGKSYGFSLEDISGGVVAMSNLSLFKAGRRPDGSTYNPEDVVGRFGERGGFGMVRAAQNTLGGKTAAETIERLSSFLGVSGANFGDMGKKGGEDIQLVRDMLTKLETVAQNAGIDKSAIVQLAEQVKGLMQQYGQGTTFGGVQAADVATKAIMRTQALATIGGVGYNNFERRSGGMGGVINMAAKAEAQSQGSLVSRYITGMLGSAQEMEENGNTGGAAGVRGMVSSFMSRGDFSFGSAQRLIGDYSKMTGTQLGNVQSALLRDRIQQKGAIYKNANGIDTGVVSLGVQQEQIRLSLLAAYRGSNGTAALRAYDEAMQTASGSDDAMVKFDEIFRRETGISGGSSPIERLFKENIAPNFARAAAQKGNKKYADELRFIDASIKAKSAVNAMMEDTMGSLRINPLSRIIQMAASGELAKKGIKGVAEALLGAGGSESGIAKMLSNGNVKDAFAELGKTDNYFSGLAGMSSGAAQAALSGEANGMSLDDMAASEDKGIQALGKEIEAGVLAEDKAGKRGQWNSMVDKSGKITTKGFEEHFSAGMSKEAYNILKGTDAFKNALAKMSPKWEAIFTSAEDKAAIAKYHGIGGALEAFTNEQSEEAAVSMDNSLTSDKRDKKIKELKDKLGMSGAMFGSLEAISTNLFGGTSDKKDAAAVIGKELLDALKGSGGLIKVVKNLAETLSAAVGVNPASGQGMLQ